MARDVFRRLLWVLGLTAAAAIIRFGRRQLVGVEDSVMAAWPGQVIFGLYFTVFVVSAQALFAHFSTTPGRGTPAQRLFLLALVGVSLDLVLVNVQEVVAHVDASYGLVVLWDVVTFFVWVRAADLARPGEEEAFNLSAAAIAAPVFKLGREILFLPYPAGFFRAYLDLWVGDALLCIWAFVTLGATRDIARVDRVARISRVVVFGICCYWLCNAVENTLLLAWPPLSRTLESGLQSRNIPPGAVGVTYVIIASAITAVVWRTNAKGLGTAFGIQRRRTAV